MVQNMKGEYELHPGILPTGLPQDGSHIYAVGTEELQGEDYMDEATRGSG